jgi:MFS family permease
MALKGFSFSEYRGIPRDANILVYSSFFNWMGVGLLWGTLQLFLFQEGISFATAGLVLTVWGLTSAGTTLIFGGVADRYGRKKLVIMGGLVASLTIGIFGLVTDIRLLFGAAVLSGLSEAMYAVAWGALLAEKAGNAKRTSAFSLSFFISTVSSAVGGFSAAILVPLRSIYGVDLVTGTRFLYIAAAILSIIGPLMILRIQESRSRLLQPEGFHIRFLPTKSRIIVRKYVFASIMIALGAGMVIPLMTGWVDLRFGVTYDVSAPILQGVNSIAMGLANLLVPTLSRRFGTVKTIVMTQGASTIFLFSIPFLPSFPIVGAVFVVRSMLMMMSNPAQNSLLMGLVPDEERSSASAISASLWRLPNSFSTFIGAYLMGLGFLALPFYLCTALYVTAISYFWFAFRHVSLPEEEVRFVKKEMVESAVPIAAADEIRG